MKTMKKIFAGIVAMFVASFAIASGNLQVNLLPAESESAIVEIRSSKLVNYEIKISDEYGDRLYSMETKMPKNGLKKQYDLSDLEDGTYWYTVKTDKEKITKQLEINEGTVEVVNIRKSAEPYFIHKENHIDFSMLNFGNEDVKIYVYDKNNSLIDEAELGNDFAILKRVDFSELRPGSYSLVVVNDYDVYSESFSKN